MHDSSNEREALFIVYAHNRAGVLARIANLFHRRALNIRSLTVGAAGEDQLAKLVLRAAAPGAELERVAAAITNLVDVLSVELTDPTLRGRELCLARVAAASASARAAVLAVAAQYRAVAETADAHSIVLEVTEQPETVGRFLSALAPFELLDVSRTGVTATPGYQSPTLREAC
jgi:acetolactate synthase-1/3 small subunit